VVQPVLVPVDYLVILVLLGTSQEYYKYYYYRYQVVVVGGTGSKIGQGFLSREAFYREYQ